MCTRLVVSETLPGTGAHCSLQVLAGFVPNLDQDINKEPSGRLSPPLSQDHVLLRPFIYPPILILVVIHPSMSTCPLGHLSHPPPPTHPFTHVQ